MKEKPAPIVEAELNLTERLIHLEKTVKELHSCLQQYVARLHELERLVGK